MTGRFSSSTAVLTTAIGIAILSWADVGKMLGAHPWWSQMTILAGGSTGLVFAYILSLFSPRWVKLLLFAVLAIGGFLAARWGGLEFAASYAENALAGKFWYFGWYFAWAGAAGVVFGLMAGAKRI